MANMRAPVLASRRAMTLNRQKAQKPACAGFCATLRL